jgi:hypothetical protein
VQPAAVRPSPGAGMLASEAVCESNHPPKRWVPDPQRIDTEGAKSMVENRKPGLILQGKPVNFDNMIRACSSRGRRKTCVITGDWGGEL